MLTNFSRTSLALGMVLANVVALVVPAAAGETTLRNHLAAGSTLTVRTIAGFIHISRGSGDAIVRAVASPGDGTGIDMHVAQDRTAGSWTVCEVPLDVTSCSGSSHDNNSHGHVDLTIGVPAGVKLDVTSVSGDVAVTGATQSVTAKSVSGNVGIATAGDASASTVSGDVKIATGGSASAKTVSGNVNAHLGSLRGSTSFDSVSGRIALAVPHTSNADVSAKTLSGDVTGGSGVRFTGDQSFVGHNLRATIGRGGTPIDIHTVSGSIDVTTI
jgi:DUF4097 and DUF4098 domain-containing protein YvlB